MTTTYHHPATDDIAASGRTEMTAIDALSAAAWAGYESGLCVIPPREDGSKAPEGEWKTFQSRRPNRGQMAAWYPGRHGVGIVTGAVSGNLECFEFDDPDAYEAFKTLAEAAGLGELVKRIETGYSEATPNNGIHWLYFCEEIAGNTKLASRPKVAAEKGHPKDIVKTLIETRGEGGFVIIAPSHGPVHPSGRPYLALAGDLGAIATITPTERLELHRLAGNYPLTARTARMAGRCERWYPAPMGGTPRSNDKPRPSYEDGKLRDPAIEPKQVPIQRGTLRSLIRRAAAQSPDK